MELALESLEEAVTKSRVEERKVTEFMLKPAENMGLVDRAKKYAENLIAVAKVS